MPTVELGLSFGTDCEECNGKEVAVAVRVPVVVVTEAALALAAAEPGGADAGRLKLLACVGCLCPCV